MYMYFAILCQTARAKVYETITFLNYGRTPHRTRVIYKYIRRLETNAMMKATDTLQSKDEDLFLVTLILRYLVL